MKKWMRPKLYIITRGNEGNVLAFCKLTTGFIAGPYSVKCNNMIWYCAQNPEGPKLCSTGVSVTLSCEEAQQKCTYNCTWGYSGTCPVNVRTLTGACSQPSTS